jgi:hypothetical protein
MAAAVAASQLNAEYAQGIDRESAYERLAAKLAPPPTPAESTVREEPAGREPEPERREPAHSPARTPRAERQDPGVVTEVVQSSAFKSFLRSAGTVLGREITRSILGTARRRR